ncbi:hypothetical protein C8R43DRAFT_957712 [Mycena crocata]|nr:hypothetical protein C8R43DRAFT_957712 [Mycena crocata]
MSGIFAIAQMLHQVVFTVLLLRLVSSEVVGHPSHLRQNSIQHLAQVKIASENILMLINNFAADGLFVGLSTEIFKVEVPNVSQTYRCFIIWDQSRHRKWVTGIPLVLLLFTTSGHRFKLGKIDFGSSIWDRQYFILDRRTYHGSDMEDKKSFTSHRPDETQRYNTAVLTLVESSALYFTIFVILALAETIGGRDVFGSPWLAIIFGACRQLINLVPALILVRVSLARSIDADSTAVNLSM